MWTSLILLILTLPAYSQVFTEDIAKINHFMAEKELDEATASGVEGEVKVEGSFLTSLLPQLYGDPFFNCHIDPSWYKPEDSKYKVLLITEDRPADPTIPSQTTIVVARFENEKGVVRETLEKLLSSQKDGVMNLKHNSDAGTNFIRYVDAGTSISLDSTVRAENTLEFDVKKIGDSQAAKADVKVDMVNRLDIKQEVSSATTLKAALEANYSSGRTNVESIENLSFDLRTVKAEARLDTAFDRNVKGFTEVNYNGNSTDKTMKVAAGMNITIPDGAEIIVFTAQRTDFGIQHAETKKYDSREIGIEYRRSRDGMKFFSRFREDEKSRDKVFESGIEIKL